MAEIPTSFLQGLQSGQSALDAADRVKLASGELALQREQLKTQREIATRQMDFEREKMVVEGELQREAEASRLEGFRRLNESNERIAREGRESQERISKAELAQREQQQKQANDLAREQMNLMKQQYEEEKAIRWHEAETMRQSQRMAVNREIRQLELAQKENTLLRETEKAGAAAGLAELKARTQLRRGLEPIINVVNESRKMGAMAAGVSLPVLPKVLESKSLREQYKEEYGPILGFVYDLQSSVIGTQKGVFAGADVDDEIAGMFGLDGSWIRGKSDEDKQKLIGAGATSFFAKDLAGAISEAVKKDPGEVEARLRLVMIAAGSGRGEEAVLAELKKFEEIGVPAEAIVAAIDSYTATALEQARAKALEAEYTPLVTDEAKAIRAVDLHSLNYLHQVHVNLRAAARGRYQTPTSVEALKAFEGREFLTGAARAQREGNLGEFLEGYLEADGLMHLADDLESLINHLGPELNSMLGAKEIVDGLRREIIDRSISGELEAAREGLDFLNQSDEELRRIYGR